MTDQYVMFNMRNWSQIIGSSAPLPMHSKLPHHTAVNTVSVFINHADLKNSICVHDDAIVGLVEECKESAYRDEGQRLTAGFQNYKLELNNEKVEH